MECYVKIHAGWVWDLVILYSRQISTGMECNVQKIRVGRVWNRATLCSHQVWYGMLIGNSGLFRVGWVWNLAFYARVRLVWNVTARKFVG